MLGTRLRLMAAIHHCLYFEVQGFEDAMRGRERKLTVSMKELGNMRPAQAGSSG